MKSNWKKLLSLALVLALMLGFAPGISMPVYASDTAINISNSNASGTHWSYDASTHTLTLDGYSYSGSEIAVYAPNSGVLTINLVGENTINSTNSSTGAIASRDGWGGGFKFTGTGSLTVTAPFGIYSDKSIEIVSGDISFICDNVGIYCDEHMTVSGGEVHATGTNCGVYTKNGGKLSITGGKLVATGGNGAIKQDNSPDGVLNSIAGTGWTDTEGTEGKADIPISTEGQTLTYKKVQFPADPVASVTSGGTTTEYTAFSGALTAWNNAANDATLTLLSDVTTGSTISVSGTKTLDLNGYGIKYTGGAGLTSSVITVGNGANLTLNDSGSTTHYYTVDGDGLATVNDSGAQTYSFTGGYITGANTYGIGEGYGAVHVVSGGTFTMYGGTIIGNRAERGGGVQNNGNFTLNDGTITGNISHVHGGGVCTRGGNSRTIIAGGTITKNVARRFGGGLNISGPTEMSGGTISDNEIKPRDEQGQTGGGGGVYVDNSFTLTGGTISGNKAVNNTDKNNQLGGGGILIGNGQLTLSGNTVIKNNSGINGYDDLYVPTGKTIAIGGELSGESIGVTMQTPGVFTNSTNTSFNDASKFVSGNAGYAVFKNSSGQLELRVPPVASVTPNSGGTPTEYTTFSGALTAWTDGSTLTLLSDVTTGSTISVTGNKTLDLNGYGIKATGTGYSVITVGSGANLTINDSNSGNLTHKFTPPETVNGKAAGKAALNEDSGALEINGGYITGGIAERGGGIYVNGGTVTLNGGTIIGNESTKSGVHEGGGGVALLTDANFTINGGFISYNTSAGNGAGIEAEGNNIHLTINSGGIHNNRAVQGNGGGIRANFADGIDFTMTGGEITNNMSNAWGNGVCFDGQTIKISGNPVIKDNCVAGVQTLYNNNLHFANSSVKVIGALASGASIGVDATNVNITSGYSQYNSNVHPNTYFFSDKSGMAVTWNDGETEARLEQAYTVTFNTDGGSTVQSQTVVSGSTVTRPADPTKAGYTFGGWYTDSGLTSAFDFNTAVSANTTLYAKWTALPVASVTPSGGTTANYSVLSDALSAWTDGSTLKLLSDVTTGSTINITGTKTLDLNGYGIRMTGNDGVINIGSGANLKLADSNPTAIHYVTLTNWLGTAVNSSGSESAVNTQNGNGVVKVSGGYITGGNKTGIGGGIYAHDSGTFAMNGGTIIGNCSVGANPGAGMAVVSGANVTLSGNAKITYNHTQDWGGAIVFSGGESGVLTIKDNAVIQYNNGQSGIHYNNGTLNLSGSPVIKENIASQMGKGILVQSSKITVNGELNAGADIHVYVYNYSNDAVFTNTGNTDYNDPSKFTSEIENYMVGKNADGQLFLGSPVTVTFDTNGGSAVELQTVAGGSVIAQPADPTKEHYTFGGWYTDSGLTTAFDFTTAITTNTTLYAKWTANQYTITFDTDGGSTIESITRDYNSTVTLPAAPTKADSSFAGWNTKADGSGTPYAPGASLTLTGNLTLYAQWTSKPLYTVSGTVKQGDAAVSGVTLRLVQGEKKIAVTATNAAGEFSFSAPDGIYNIVAVKDGKTKTELVTLNAAQTVDIVLPTDNVNSTLTVSGSEITNVMVGGLDELAEAVSNGAPVTVTMTVEEKAAADVGDTEKNAIIAEAGEIQTLDYLDITIRNGTTPITDTDRDYNKVLEIVVPYRFTGKENVAVYRYHGSATPLDQLNARPSGSYEDGKYYIDKANSLIYIYASKFSTYAIGYTQCYNISGTIKYGTTYTGSVRVSLLEGETEKYTATASLSGGSGTYSFTHVLAGTYTLRAVWTEGGKETTLNETLLVQ